MKIERIDGDRNVNKDIEKVMINVNGHRYTLTEEFGQLRIHAHRDRVMIYPASSNELIVDSHDT